MKEIKYVPLEMVSIFNESEIKYLIHLNFAAVNVGETVLHMTFVIKYLN